MFRKNLFGMNIFERLGEVEFTIIQLQNQLELLFEEKKELLRQIHDQVRNNNSVDTAGGSAESKSEYETK